MSLVKWNSNGNHTTPGFTNLLESFFGRDLADYVGRDFTRNVPAVNVVENPESFKVEVAAPGLKKEHFHINLHNNVLSIAAHTEQDKEESNGRYTRREFGYTSFQRSFTLPNSVDAERIQANYQDGVLYIHLPKREEAKEKPARQIDIS
jgi:HSP20 family protein